MLEAIRRTLEQDQRVQYALIFGSGARGSAHPGSDIDIAIGLSEPLELRELGDLVGRLESACGRTVDLVLMDEAPPALAYRVFRDGVTVVERDRQALVHRKALAILEYLDFKPIEDLCARGVLMAAKNGR